MATLHGLNVCRWRLCMGLLACWMALRRVPCLYEKEAMQSLQVYVYAYLWTSMCDVCAHMCTCNMYIYMCVCVCIVFVQCITMVCVRGCASVMHAWDSVFGSAWIAWCGSMRSRQHWGAFKVCGVLFPWDRSPTSHGLRAQVLLLGVNPMGHNSHETIIWWGVPTHQFLVCRQKGCKLNIWSRCDTADREERARCMGDGDNVRIIWQKGGVGWRFGEAGGASKEHWPEGSGHLKACKQRSCSQSPTQVLCNPSSLSSLSSSPLYHSSSPSPKNISLYIFV